MKKIRKIWHAFTLWEDLGMWRDISKEEQDKFLPLAIAFTGDAKKYGDAMIEVLDKFPVACEHNLSDLGMNRQAWIGHAACYLATGCPEYITRQAWAKLTADQQIDANAKADIAIRLWEMEHEKEDTVVDYEMGRQRVFGWNP